MNRGQLVTAIIGSRFGTQRSPDAQMWLASAEGWVWDQAEWKFKRVDELTRTVTAGDRSLPVPADYGEGLVVANEIGDELTELSPREFTQMYLGGKIALERGAPDAFCIDNGTIRLGPTPDQNRTFYLSYRRQLFHFESDGSTVTAGPMNEDDDYPAFHPVLGKHHMVLVHHAAMIGLADENDPSAITQEQLRDRELQSMLNDRTLLRPTPRLQYGRINW